MKNNILYLILVSILLTSCKDKFSSINTDPEKTPPRIEFLFTEGLKQMNPQDYIAWYWNYNTMMPWMQYLASAGGNSDQLGKMTDMHEDFEQMINVKRQLEGIKYELASMPKGLAQVYEDIEAMCYSMTIYMGLKATDASGSIPYSEAAKGYFEGEKYFIPKFDSQKELFTTWLKELKDAIEVLSRKLIDENGKEISKKNIGKNDFVYQGNVEKWIKFTNSMRLKIVVRLMHEDETLARETVKDIMKYPLILSSEDDFIWCPGAQWINSPNQFDVSTGSKHLLEFLVKNRDPRVRFLFKKNQFNETIINGFLSEGKKLPSFIAQNIVTTDDNSKFLKWKNDEEPWARYHGVPVDIKSKEYTQNMDDYYTPIKRQLGSGTNAKTYAPWSNFNDCLLQGQYKYVYPTLPGENVEVTRNSNVIFNHLSAGEINLYLAELKVLGFDGIPNEAQIYYQDGIKYSVMMYDKLGELNNIPYYKKVNGLPESDLPIALQAGEIDNLLDKDDYKLIGNKNEQLERIYVQMYIHFGMYPADLFTTVRRTGVPIKGSNYFSQAEWDSKTKQDLIIPRRLQVKSLTTTDELMNERKKAYEEQGFTPGDNEPATLNKERIWFDLKSPEYGKGPNY